MVAVTRMREVFTATALLLIVGIAVLMMQIGLSPALGTFMAGVVLANSEYKHELESDLEPFKGFCWGCFLLQSAPQLISILFSHNQGWCLDWFWD